MRSLFVVVVAIGALLVGGCAQWDMNLPADRPAIREFTARDVLDTLGVAQMANAAALEARLGSLDRSLLPDIVQALDLIRAAEAQAKGATAKGITVFVIDDFSYWKFKDGRYHGD